ncbi:MAG: PHP domain-containing protein [Sphaerochaetaceae bacterium]
MGYLYETHLHTRCASLCSDANPKDYVRKYQEQGFAGLIVTDHFFNGNCRIRKGGNWPDMVDQYCSGYEEAAEEGLRCGLDVFFGWESSYYCDDYLVYGLDKQWLKDHPEIVSCTRKQQFDWVNEAGGAIVQAHPFRERDYIVDIKLSPYLVHAVEVANAENEAVFDQRAYQYAKQYNLTMTAGSDIHRTEKVSCSSYGVISPTKWKSIDDYTLTLRRHQQLELHANPECFLPIDSKPNLKVIMMNRS